MSFEKSSYCGSSACIEVDTSEFRTSSYCGSAACVEVGGSVAVGTVRVRDGKLGVASPVLAFTAEQWTDFVAGVQAGDFGA